MSKNEIAKNENSELSRMMSEKLGDDAIKVAFVAKSEMLDQELERALADYENAKQDYSSASSNLALAANAQAERLFQSALRKGREFIELLPGDQKISVYGESEESDGRLTCVARLSFSGSCVATQRVEAGRDMLASQDERIASSTRIEVAQKSVGRIKGEMAKLPKIKAHYEALMAKKRLEGSQGGRDLLKSLANGAGKLLT
jgi:hypothetical protein